MQIGEQIGKQIRTLRKKHGLTQTTGIAETIATRLYFSEMSEDELEKDVPGARQALQGLREWIE